MMFRNLWQRLTQPRRPALPAVPDPGDLPELPGRDAASGEPPFTADVLGPTLVATVVNDELTGFNTAEVAAAILDWLEQHPAVMHLVLDLQNVRHLDSGGVSRLVFLLREVQMRGGRVAIASGGSHVEGLFKLTRLDRVFPVKRGVIDAIAAVERSAAA